MRVQHPSWSASFLQHIAVPGARAEVGIAVGVRPGQDGEAVLVSYNPRQRSVTFRLRIAATLKALGFSLGWLRTLSPLIPDARGSWVIGLEATADRIGGTLYIEELDRFFSPTEQQALWQATAAALRLPLPPPIATGAPYILAIDFEPTGATRLKRYHLLPPGSGGPPADLPVPGVLRPDHDGHLLQRRGGDDSTKVYRCYPYQTHPERAAEAWRDWRALTGQTAPPLGLPDDTPITSIGARLLDGVLTEVVVYAALPLA
jgi:hypothetical protein